MNIRLGKKYNQDFYSNLAAGSLKSAFNILQRLYTVYEPKSVVDFGCGVGAWLFAAEKLGSTELRGYDGIWVDTDSLLTKSIVFTPADMESSVCVSKKFDLAISVEVAEHLSVRRAASFIRDICLSSDVVVFGAAVKGQGGTNHINEQPQSYWVRLFFDNGYVPYDIFRGGLWGDVNIEWWYRQNVFLFVKQDIQDGKIDLAALKKLEIPIIDVIHPEHLKKVITNPGIAIKRFFQNLRS